MSLRIFRIKKIKRLERVISAHDFLEQGVLFNPLLEQSITLEKAHGSQQATKKKSKPKESKKTI
jgi:hypothetical protein